MQDKDVEVGGFVLTTELLRGLLHILRQLLHSVLERCPGIIDLINDQDVLADQVRLVDGGEIEPLGAGDLGAGGLLGVVEV